MAKGEALIRDIARLFVKYGVDDWAVVVELLRTGGPEHVQIAQAIAEISAKRPTSNKQSKQAKPSRAPVFAPNVEPHRAELLSKVYGHLSRTTGPRLAELRDIYIRSGGKRELPEKRDDIAKALVLHLAYLPDDAFAPLIKSILGNRRDFQGEYAKWFDMIYLNRATQT